MNKFGHSIEVRDGKALIMVQHRDGPQPPDFFETLFEGSIDDARDFDASLRRAIDEAATLQGAVAYFYPK